MNPGHFEAFPAQAQTFQQRKNRFVLFFLFRHRKFNRPKYMAKLLSPAVLWMKLGILEEGAGKGSSPFCLFLFLKNFIVVVVHYIRGHTITVKSIVTAAYHHPPTLTPWLMSNNNTALIQKIKIQLLD